MPKAWRFLRETQKRRAVFQHRVRGLERGGNCFRAKSSSALISRGMVSSRPKRLELYFTRMMLICGAAQQIGAEHDGFKVKLLAGFYRHGGVQLSAVEKHNALRWASNRSERTARSARAASRESSISLCQLHGVKAVFAVECIVHHGHQWSPGGGASACGQIDFVP